MREQSSPDANASPLSDHPPSGDERLLSLVSSDAWQATQLSPRLHALVERVAKDSDNHARRNLDLIVKTIPGYAHATSDLRADVQMVARGHLEDWYRALLSGTSPASLDHIASVTDIARRRLHQGISMGDLMRAYRLAFRETWRVLIEAVGNDSELQLELLQKVALNLMVHVDTHAQTIFEAYVAEERQQVRNRDRLRRELSSLLFSRPGDMAGFRELGAALGLDTDMPATAFSFRLRDANAVMLRVDESLDRFATEIARALGVSVDSFLRTLRGDHLLVWRSVPPGHVGFEYDRKLAVQAAAVLRAVPDLIAAGVGLPGSGPHGWRVAAEQAMRALEMQAPTDAHTVSCYSELVLIDGAASSENARRFFESITDRLALEPNLLETLQTYFDFKQQRKRVAAELDVHPNTLDHRLARIEKLLDLSLQDVAWLARLQVALQLWARSVDKTSG